MHFVITFGFQISKKSDGVKGDQFMDTGKVTVKKKNRRDKKKKIQNMSGTTYSPNVINVGEVLAEIHVEYEILTGYTFKFDCRCWETATKIYTLNGNWSLRPILCPIRKDVLWIIFSVHHIVELNQAQLQSFFNHVITYRLSYGKNKFSERARKDKVKEFYIDDSSMNVGPYDFLEIYSRELYDSNFVKKSSIPTCSEPIIVTNEVYGNFSIVTYLDMIPDKAHEYKFRKMLRKNRFPPELFDAKLLQDEQQSISKTGITSVPKKRLKGNKLSKQKRDREFTCEIYLPAETMFSDMGTTTCFKRTLKSSNVSSVLIYTECRNVLSNKQLRIDLNPIAVKLEQLSNFPADVVIENDFKYMYIKILFLKRTIITPYYVPEKTMCFEFIKCFLCKEFHPTELINSLATNLLIVEIIGIRVKNVIEDASFEPDTLDKDVSVIQNLSNMAKVSKKEEVLLGVAQFDISDLLRGFWEMRLINTLSHPCNINFICANHTNNEEIQISWKNSPLTNDILTSCCTSVKIKVRLSYNLRKIEQAVLRHKDVFNRIFLILNDTTLINDILRKVSYHNSNLLKTYQFPDTNGDDSKTQIISKDILTGFVIDCCETFYIFLEGLSNGHLLRIWEMVAHLSFRNKCVYYNSNLIFSVRLYEDLVPLGGVIHIKLSDPLEIQLRKCNLYIGETKRIVRANVLRTMGLMKLTSTMKSLCQACLFPQLSSVKTFLDEIRKIQFELPK